MHFILMVLLTPLSLVYEANFSRWIVLHSYPLSLRAHARHMQLYEDDARIGHQEFDLKLTERVKMSMVRAIMPSLSQ